MADININCPKCHQTIEIDTDWYGQEVQCPLCDRYFQVPYPPARRSQKRDDSPRREEEPAPILDDDDRERPRRRPRYEEDEDEERGERRRRRYAEEDDEDERYDQRRRRRYHEPPPKKSNRGLWIGLAVGIGSIVLVCLGGCGWLGYTFNAPAEYKQTWVKQSLPDGSASVDFPRAPRSEPVTEPGCTGTNYLMEDFFPQNAEFVFGYIDHPLLTPSQFPVFCDEIKKNFGKELGRPVLGNRMMTISGCEAMESTVDLGGKTPGIFRWICVPKSNGGMRVVVVGAGGRNLTAADQQKFLNSLKFSATPK